MLRNQIIAITAMLGIAIAQTVAHSATMEQENSDKVKVHESDNPLTGTHTTTETVERKVKRPDGSSQTVEASDKVKVKRSGKVKRVQKQESETTPPKE